MRDYKGGRNVLLVASVLALMAAASSVSASARTTHSHEKVATKATASSAHSGAKVTMISFRTAQLDSGGRHSKLSKNGKARYSRSGGGGGGISCVPYARMESGIDVKGNAANWWEAASGTYERGFRPEPGSVLNFRATGRMRLGHVAVVAAVVDSRTIQIDHANWSGPGASKGGVSRGIPVVDVSQNNDWSEVRVGLGRTGDFGSVYPTYGFIYSRPDSGVMVANTLATGGRRGGDARYEEVAEAPAHPRGAPMQIDPAARDLGR